MLDSRHCSLCGNWISFENEEQWQAHRRGCRYRVAQQTGQENTYLGTAGRGIQRQLEYNRRQREHLQERIIGLERAMARIRENKLRDAMYREELQAKRDNVRPGRKAEEIRADLQRKIERVSDQIHEKDRKLESMRVDLDRMKEELRGLP